MTDQPTGTLTTEQSKVDELTSRPPEPDENGVVYLTKQEAEDLFDRQARKYVGMSGAEFRRQYRAGTIDPERSDVIRVSFLMHLADE